MARSLVGGADPRTAYVGRCPMDDCPMNSPTLNRRAQYRWPRPVPRRWTSAFAHNMVWAEIMSHFRPLSEYEQAAWNGEIGSIETWSFYEGVKKPRIYPGKRWARP